MNMCEILVILLMVPSAIKDILEIRNNKQKNQTKRKQKGKH